jgi:dipeptidyl aminopeptidase/acylaminoacyl peptidase
MILGLRRCAVLLPLVTLSFTALPLPALPLHAQAPQRALTPASVAISPDGQIVAWSVRQREGVTLHLNSVANPDPAKEQIIAPNGATNCSNETPAWSPDSQSLAFFSTCTSKDDKPGQPELFLWSRKDATTRQLTHVVGYLSEPAWSPDGKTIAFLFVENATRVPGGHSPQDMPSGVIGQEKSNIQGVYGFDLPANRGSWLVPATQLMHTFHFAWSPGSKDIAVIASAAPGENNWWVSKLYVYDLARSAATSVLDPNTIAGPLHGLQIAVPSWSPDGKRLAVIGGLMSDEGSTGGDIWVVDAKPNSQPVDITPNIDGTPTWETWLNDRTIGFVEDRRGHILLSDADVEKRAVTPGSTDDLGEISLTGGPVKNAVTASNAGVIAFVESSVAHAPEIYTLDVAAEHATPKPYSHFNDNLKSTARTESVEWTNEGFHVQGWLTYPIDYDAHKKYPIIVEVHGGPSASTGVRFGGSTWAADGYFEFQPNPRGSFGQGEAFTQANRKDFGYGDLRDILTGMDAIEASVPAIDHHREGLTGWSYGGFMSMFAPTQTQRFRAIVAGAGISDWLSYYGENSIDQWMIPFFGASVYDDPAVYAKSSAITFIKQAKTPMLILVGDRDGECPPPQSYEMWHALRDLGVKTELVIYPNEGHGFTNPDHIRDRNQRTHEWFAENMK